MGTRATIIFSEGENESDDKYYVYRGHDGFPENIIPDLELLIKDSKERWSMPEVGLMVTMFLAMNFDFTKFRLPDYEITPCIHGDESYVYYFTWNKSERRWIYGIK